MAQPSKPAGGQRKPGLRTARLEALSDGVFAIALTLLVLEIAVPGGLGKHLLRALARLWPSYLAYVVRARVLPAAADEAVRRLHRRDQS